MVPTVAVDATPLLGPRTGIGVFVAGLLEHTAAQPDLRLRAFGLTGRGFRDLPGVLPDGVRARRLPLPAGPALRVWRRTPHPTIEWWTGRVDVVHGTNYVVPPSRSAVRLVAVYDLTAVHWPELCPPSARRYPELVRRAVAEGAWIHTLARSVAEECVADLGADPDRVRVIPPGIAQPTVPAIGPAPGPTVPTTGRPPGPTDAPYILALGTVEPRKDLPTLVAAWDRVAGDHLDLELRIAGPRGWGEEALADVVAAARHRPRIRRLGWVEDRDALLDGALAVAYPSLYEGFGFPPLEAMARGVPVVASTAGALPETVGDAALLVAPRDVDALAGALERVVTDNALRRDLAIAGRERAARFDWDTAGAAYAALYRELAGLE